MRNCCSLFEVASTYWVAFGLLVLGGVLPTNSVDYFEDTFLHHIWISLIILVLLSVLSSANLCKHRFSFELQTDQETVANTGASKIKLTNYLQPTGCLENLGIFLTPAKSEPCGPKCLIFWVLLETQSRYMCVKKIHLLLTPCKHKREGE